MHRNSRFTDFEILVIRGLYEGVDGVKGWSVRDLYVEFSTTEVTIYNIVKLRWHIDATL